MAQQLNLFDPRFGPVVRRFTARQGLVAVVLAVGSLVAAGQALQVLADRAAQQAQALDQANAPLRAQLLAAAKQPGAAAPDTDAELARLRALEAGQRRIRAALDAGVAGAREGHAEYLAALARQANGQVWITGLQVAEGGATLDLQGRMLDPGALPDYLRRLNHEPRFRGRPFAQLALQTITPGEGQTGYSEFNLRAHAYTGTAGGLPLPAAPTAPGAPSPESTR